MSLIKNAVIYLIRTQPFYAHLLTKLHVLEDDRVPIAGYSIEGSQINLHLNTFVYNQLSLENQTKILIHELLHLVDRHAARQGNRDQELWNMACDIAINQMIPGIPITQIVKMKELLPDITTGIPREVLTEKEVGGLTPDNLKQTDGSQLVFPANLFAEEYYNLLLKHTSKDQNPGSSGLDTGNQLVKEADLHPTWANSNKSPRDLLEAVVGKAAKEAADRSQGNIPDNIKVYLQDLSRVRTPWRRILRIFTARQVFEKRYLTFKKHNKRLMEEGLPGLKKEKRLQLVAAIDTSASISQPELLAFASEILTIKKTGVDITVIECDCQVKTAYKLKKVINSHFSGRGGTDFRPVWKYLEENRLRPDGIIYLTDGKGEAPLKSPYQTLWALTPNGDKPWMTTPGGRTTVNWGRFVTLDIS